LLFDFNRKTAHIFPVVPNPLKSRFCTSLFSDLLSSFVLSIKNGSLKTNSMGKIIAGITMSLDGFIAGPHISNAQPLGANGEKLHEWVFGKATEADKKIVDEGIRAAGAVIAGNHTYRTAIDGGWGGVTPFEAPAFILCHAVPSRQVKGFEYITGGIHAALDRAKETAKEKNIWIMGGANVIQQYIKAGLADELRLHIAPILLMQGTRLFENTGIGPLELVKEKVVETAAVLHTVFRFKK
jgi:dihydrofolate reductase